MAKGGGKKLPEGAQGRWRKSRARRTARSEAESALVVGWTKGFQHASGQLGIWSFASKQDVPKNARISIEEIEKDWRQT